MAKNNRTIFDGLENNPLDSVNTLGNYFTGNDPIMMGESDINPFISGYAFIYWVKLPTWFEEDPDLKYFKTTTQKFMRSFNGITDIELQDSQHQSGFAGNEFSVVTGIQRGNTDFTIGFREASGSPIRKLIQKWVTLIRDPNTGISLYPTLYNMEYGMKNHTGQLLYIQLRPDVTNTQHNNIEFSVLYTNVYPVNIPLSALYSYEMGSEESPTSVDINFKGVPNIGHAIDKFAKEYLEKEILNTSPDNNSGYIFLDSLTMPGDQNTELLNSGINKKIYNIADKE